MQTIPVMNRRFALLAAISLVSTSANSQGSTPIPLSSLEAMFASIRKGGKFDVEKPLLWGYFFFDVEVKRLTNAANELRTSGYTIVRLEQVPRERDYILHVEKVEVHTPKSLYARNLELYKLADKYGIRSYDGMDVGAVGGLGR